MFLIFYFVFFIIEFKEDKVVQSIYTSLAGGLIVPFLISMLNYRYSDTAREMRKILTILINGYRGLENIIEKVNMYLDNKTKKDIKNLIIFVDFHNILIEFIFETKDFYVFKENQTYEKITDLKNKIISFFDSTGNRIYINFQFELEQNEIAEMQMHINEINKVWATFKKEIKQIEFAYLNEINDINDRLL